ncbi:MAG: rhomboid family intramembrane serine protease [Sciscionella sp.]
MRSTPVVTIVLIALNVLVFAFTAYQAHSIANNAHSPLAQDWELFPYAVAGGQWWRIITSGFIHYGPIHIAMNMIALWIIGRDMETVLGRLRYIVVYVLSLIGGGVAVFLFNNPHGLVAGASGAVFGLMGGVVIACYRLKISPRTALMVIAVNLVFSFSIPGISWLGHLGGLVVGALATVGMLYAPVAKRKPIQLATVIGLFVLLVGLFFLRDAQFAHIICAPHGLRCVQVS